MRIVGIDFRDGILFVPEVLSSCKRYEGWNGYIKAFACKKLELLELDKMVIGTVKGDIHDIRKKFSFYDDGRCGSLRLLIWV